MSLSSSSPRPRAVAETPSYGRPHPGVSAEKGGLGEVNAPVLDDVDARPGSTTSLLRTVVGLYLRQLGGSITSATLVRLAEDLGIPAARARTAITRLKKHGLLLGSGGDLVLNPAAITMLERGDRRIFAVRTMSAGDEWMLVSVTIPETRRDLRHQLRRRLQYLGAGAVSAGLWILPGHLDAEVEELLDELGARAFATLFRTTAPRPPMPLAEAAAGWWDLDMLRSEHERFLASVDELDVSHPFAAYTRLLDSWRVIPYTDPGLPADLLPADWPGARSIEAFQRLRAELADAALAHVRDAV